MRRQSLIRGAGCQSVCRAKRHTGVTAALLAAALLATPIALLNAADSPDQFLDRIRSALERQKFGKVLVSVREDDQSQSTAAAVTEVKGLEQRLADICRKLGTISEKAPPAAALDDLTLTGLPDPGDLKDLLAAKKADAVLAVTWKGTKTATSLRVALMTGSRIVWTGRISIKSSATAIAAKSKSSKSTKAATASYGGFGSKAGGYGASSLIGTGFTGSGTGGSGTAAGAGGLGGQNGNAAAAGGTAEINAQVLEFAVKSLGTQVGNGECWTLADEALKYAGAQPPDMYDFGEEVTLPQLAAGDILHFVNAQFVSPPLIWVLGAPDHVAVVGDIRGTVVTLLHQNVNGARIVRKDIIDLSTLVSGSITGYRPQAKSSTENSRSDE